MILDINYTGIEKKTYENTQWQQHHPQVETEVPPIDIDIDDDDIPF